MRGIHSAVGQDDVVHALVDGRFRLLAQGGQGFLQGRLPSVHVEQDEELHGVEALVAYVAQDVQLGVGQYGVRQSHHLAVRFARQQDVHAHGADVLAQRHDQFLTYRVDGRVGHLGELLAEIVEQQLGLVGEHGQRGVVPHGSGRLRPARCHRDERAFDVFACITESTQAAVVILHYVFHLPSAPQGVQFDTIRGEPLPVRFGGSQLGFQFPVIIYFSFLGVHQQYLARLQPSFFLDVSRLEVDGTRFAGHDHHVVPCYQVAGRAQAVTVEHASGITPVTEEQGGRPVPWLHQDGVVLIESLQVFADGVLVVEGLRHQHGHGVGQAQAGHDEKLQYVVQ